MYVCRLPPVPRDRLKEETKSIGHEEEEEQEEGGREVRAGAGKEILL